MIRKFLIPACSLFAAAAMAADQPAANASVAAVAATTTAKKTEGDDWRVWKADGSLF